MIRIRKVPKSFRLCTYVKRYNSTSVFTNSSPSDFFKTVPRSHRDNFLNISPFDVNEATSTDINRFPNYGTNILLNLFFQSILMNDFHKSRSILNKFKMKVKNNPSKSQINNYYSCLSILLSHLILNSSTLVVHNLKAIVDEFNEFEKTIKRVDLAAELKENREEIKVKLLYCLIYSYNNIPIEDKILRYRVSQYILLVLRNFGFNSEKFCETINDDSLFNNFIEIAHLTKSQIRHIKRPIQEIDVEKDPISIEPFKDDSGFISFDNLCCYISSTRFLKYDTESRKFPLYEIFEKLPVEEKDKFLKDYLEFNKFKEFNIESNSLDLVDSFYAPSSKQTDILNLARFKSSHSTIIYSWYEINFKQLNFLINRLSDPNYLETLSSSKNKEDEVILSKYLIYLNLLPKKLITTLIISNLLSNTISSESGYIKLTELANTLSSSFTRLLIKEPSYKHIKDELLKFFKEEDGIQLFATLIKVFIENCKISSSLIDSNSFEKSLRLFDDYQDGIDKSFLIESNGSYPAFQWGLLKNPDQPNYKKVGIIKIHPYLLSEFQSHKSLTLSKSLYLPMLCPPKPWISPTEGGYLQDLKPIINTTDLKSSLVYLRKAHETDQLNSTYKGLDLLGSNPWAINNKVLEIFNKVMEFDDGFLKIPPRLDNLEIKLPNKPNRNDFKSIDEFREAEFKHKLKKSKLIQEYHNFKGQRIEYDLVQKLSNSLGLNGDIFYLPHNVDFRGRAYPMVSILSHYQDDLVRALLMFWFAKPLGPNGFGWIKYHLAGVYGKDKLPMNERLEFINSNLDLIIDSAENPLNGKMWWKSGEKPWQTLNLCIEVNSILKYAENGNNIEAYHCRIPIHQDGSCNGLQHYAALGNDKEGGLSVNLLPSDPKNEIRGDIYSKVLDIVKSKVLKDAKDDNSNNKELANIALPILARKVVKQTVMTTVYGVTTFGGAAQIQERIKEIIKNMEMQLHEGKKISITITNLNTLNENQRKVAVYLSTIVLNSISELFSGAKLIQGWLLNNCFRIIHSFDLKTCNFIKSTQNKEPDFFKPSLYKPMMWTSLSGFPIVQLYKNTKQTAIPSSLQQIMINKPNKLATINTRKQLNAIAPNFIHSIDSIHMFMTCISANKNCIPFVSVHDSFWTYPCDVDNLSKLIRQEFVRLHSSNIIEHLRDDMIYTTKNSFQLVWIDNSENEELVNELRKLRNTYFKKSLSLTKSNYNKILSHELELQTNQSENTPLQLIERYEPKLYFGSKDHGHYLQLYDTNTSMESIKLLKNKFTPILVPVKILNRPPTGKLDIRQVLNSKYFFS